MSGSMRDWLASLALEHLTPVFEENQIGLRDLPLLNEDDLKELGVPMGPRKRLLREIAGTFTTAGGEHGEDPRHGEAERRQLTVMFCDLVGSTALSARLDPEDLRDLMQRYQDAVVDAVARYGGHVARYLGDGVLTYFGWPRAHEDQAERAVRAGLDAAREVAALHTDEGDALSARVGIASGLVVVGDLVGESGRDPGAISGETPNLAARLQQTAEPGQVVISETTRRLVGRSFALQDLGRRDLKGFADAIAAWRVLGDARVDSRFEAAHGRSPTPLIGRRSELGMLLDRWETTKRGEGRVVLLSGEPGIGKSRLLLALRERIAPEPHFRLRYQCSPYHSNSPLYPVIQRLERVAGFATGDDNGAKLDKLEALLSISEGDVGNIAPLFAALLSIPADDRYSALELTPDRRSVLIVEALCGQILALSRRRPVLFAFEDAHWIDPTTQALLAQVVSRIGDARVLMVITHRPEWTAPFAGQPHVTGVGLGRLSRAEAAALVRRLAGDRASEAIVSQAVARTDGVPLFVEELSKSLLSAAAGGYAMSSDVPATLQASLLARLDQLDADAKELAKAGAVIGREFPYSLLRAASSLSAQRFLSALEQFDRSGLVFSRGTPPDASFSYRHVLLQEAAYHALLRGQRRTIHGRIARHLEQRSPQVAERQPELLAHHFGEAGAIGSAAKYWLRAGLRAKQRYANTEARAHLQMCLDATATAAANEPNDLARVSETKRDALVLLGGLAGLDGDLDGANAFYETALAARCDAAAGRAIQNMIHRRRTVVRDGARIVFYEHGHGEHTLVFANAIVYGLAVFQMLIERLCQDFHIVTVDWRGTGESDPLIRPFPLQEHVRDLVAVIEALDRGPIVGVGISQGGRLLIRLADSNPELICRLVTVGCPPAQAASGDVGGFAPAFRRQRAKAFENEDIAALLRIQNAFVYSEPGTEELRRRVFEQRIQLPRDTILNFYSPDPGSDVTPLLKRLTIPTLITHGTEDRLIDFAAAAYLAKEIPNAQLYAFEGSGHLPLFTATDEFCDVLKRFIRDQPLT